MSGEALKPVEYEQLVVGEEFGPVRVVVDDAAIKQHAFALDDYAALVDGAGLAHSSLLLADLLRLLNLRYDPHHDRGLHQREEFWVAAPLPAGTEVELHGVLTGIAWRRGRPYFTVEAEARRVDDGSLVLRHRAVEAVGIGDPSALGGGSSRDDGASASRRITGELPDAAAVALPLGADVAVGDRIPALGKRPTQTQVSVYSNVGAFWRTTHTDLEVARAEGLDRPIAQGLMEAAYLAELAHAAFGAPWLTTGHADIAFIAPMFPGDAVTAVGRVSAVEPRDDGRRVEIECWIESDATGAKLAVGWVDAVLPD